MYFNRDSIQDTLLFVEQRKDQRPAVDINTRAPGCINEANFIAMFIKHPLVPSLPLYLSLSYNRGEKGRTLAFDLFPS